MPKQSDEDDTSLSPVDIFDHWEEVELDDEKHLVFCESGQMHDGSPRCWCEPDLLKWPEGEKPFFLHRRRH